MRASLPAFRVTGSAGDKPGSADDKTGSTWERRRQTWERRRHVSEHVNSQLRSVGKTTSSFGMLLVRLEIIATTYRSMIFKTHVFSLYSHLCIYVSIKLPIETRYNWTGCRRSLEQFRVCLKMMIEWTQRYTQRPSSSEFRDALGGDNRAYLEIHLEAMIKWT